jgi:hypothetical protein
MTKTEKEPSSETPTRATSVAVVLRVLEESFLPMTGDLERGDEDGDLRGEYFSCRTVDTSSVGVMQ